jgi:zinc/manganese transport system permease protein
MLVVLNLVAGFHALGTLMAVGIMVLPAATARLWLRRMLPLLVVAPLLAASACVMGLLLSYHADWPTGPAIVLCLGAFYVVSMLAAPFGVIRTLRPSRVHLKG